MGAAVTDRAREHVLEQLELAPAADERRRAEPARRLDRPQRAPRPHGLRPSSDLDLARALHLDRTGGKAASGRAEQDLAGLRGLLQSRGEVHGLAGGERRLRVLDHDLAGLDSDAHGEPQLLDRRHDGQSRTQRALGVVLVGERDFERGHHGVAGELLHGAAVRLDAARDLLEVPVDALPHDLGIGRDDEARRIDEVHEQDGCDLALHRPMVRSGRERSGAVPGTVPWTSRRTDRGRGTDPGTRPFVAAAPSRRLGYYEGCAVAAVPERSDSSDARTSVARNDVHRRLDDRRAPP